MSQRIIEIDGATMEGGGQILRMAVAFSALLKKPIKVNNIRAGRSKPGLRPQHLAGLKLVRDFTNGQLLGAEVGSTEITFYPGDIQDGKYSADTGTAGSIMLLFQVSFPCLLFAGGTSKLHFTGGTNADMAPQIDHTLMVFKPIAELLGARFDCRIIKRGYFPKGGGVVEITVYPVEDYLKSVELLNPGEITDITGISFVAGVLPLKLAHEMADSATCNLQQKFSKVPIKIERLKEPAHLAEGNGTGIVLVAKTSTGCLIGSGALGKRGVTSSVVGASAAKDLLDDCDRKACVDSYLQDQLVIFMALAKGISKVNIGKVTLHTKTAVFIAELMTEARFTFSADETQQCIMECKGIGLQR
ncbi:RNA 3'-terminal phosphate cyclase-like [Uloborus diversus]|uniref:RNA 3'-terminal phosphate cyclase-like n=1 Tax=Uloborus diversus TaxID=327109 RepID=UPI00240931F7|nr:RNA 3'-terminal phosphate cyclase-like [Uloborus diversus]